MEKKLRKALILDWSAIVKNRLASLLSAEMPMTRMDEIEEVRYRIARMLYPIVAEHSPEVIIVAKDNKKDGKRNYWREGYLKMWYSKNIKQATSDGELYLNIDNKWYKTFEDESGVKLGDKLTKKDTPKDLEECNELTPEQLKMICPKYKGKRKNAEWVYEMTEEEFNTAMDKAAIDVCGLADKGRIIDADLAEADDVAAVLSLNFHENCQHILVTVDSDWFQLKRNNTLVYNIYRNEWVDLENPDEFVLTKIIQGDTGDGVSSTWVDGKSVNIGKTKAPEYLNKTHELNQEVFQRNTKLIRLDLDTIPKIVQKNITEEARKPVKVNRTKWLDFTLTEKNIAELMTPNEQGGSLLSKKHEPSPVTKKVVQYNSDDEELPF